MDIKDLRQKLKLTQSQLAKKIGVTTRTIQKWESGDTIPVAMVNLLNSMIEKSETRTEFVFEDCKTETINSSVLKSILDELGYQRESSRVFQDQIGKLLIIIDKLSTK